MDTKLDTCKNVYSCANEGWGSKTVHASPEIIVTPIQ